MSGDIVTIAVTAIITGIVAAGGGSMLTVAGLRVHVEYLKQATEKNEKAITRAHQRIDKISEKDNCDG